MSNNKDIVILSDVLPSKHKIFDSILKECGFRNINHISKEVPISVTDINKYKPKLVIVVGQKAADCLVDSDINTIAGKLVNANGYNIFFTFDILPIVSKDDFIYSLVLEHFRKISDLYFNKIYVKEKHDNIPVENKLTKCHSFTLPDWCYDENHILIDIQNNKFDKKIIFIFRNKDGKKVIHKVSARKRYFYTYPDDIKDSDFIKDVTEVELKFKNDGLLENVATYEGDVSLELKHAIDYYYNRTKPECQWELRKLFWDIEVYTSGSNSFPFALEAKHPINAISFKLNLDLSPTYAYLLKVQGMDTTSYTENTILSDDVNQIDKMTIQNYLSNHPTLNNLEIKLFDTEKELVDAFLDKAKELDPDVWAGWNTDFFDIPYLVNRMHKLGIDAGKISPIGEADIDISVYKGTTAYGVYFVDQMVLYKQLTQNQEDSYSLSYICTKILGKDKVSHTESIDTMFEDNLVKFIEYSGKDTLLLAELEDAIKHISLKFELLKSCCSTWQRSETSSGLVDPLLLKFAKDRNKVCRNRIYNNKESFSGAYVLDPKIGLHKWVCDFDFASLYPSIIRTMNIGPNTFMAKVDGSIAELYLYDRDKLPDIIEIKYKPLFKSSPIKRITSKEFIDYVQTNNYIITINGCLFKQHDEELSFFYEVLENLGNQRKYYKGILGDVRQKLNTDQSLTDVEKENLKIEMDMYDNKQQVYKVVMNSIYGIISMPYFRMFSIDMAKAITATGQEALKFSILHLSNYMKHDTLDIDLKFLSKFEQSDLPYIVYGDSVCKDSIINLENENKTIEELWLETETPIQLLGDKEVKILNKKILTSNDNKQSVFLISDQIIRHKVNKKIYRIYISNETYIDVTEDHSIINYDDNLNFKEVKPNDCKYILLNKFIPRFNIEDNSFQKELYELFGFWIGDGSYNSNKNDNYLCISSGIDTDEFIEKVLKPLKCYGKITNYYKHKNNYDIKILCKHLVLNMKELGFTGTSKTKQIPKFMFKETEKNICSFLRGYFSSDGSGKSNNVILSSINKTLLKEVQILLKYCNISTRLLKDNSGNSYNSDNITSYTYQLKVYDEEEFYNKIGFLFDRKTSSINIPDIIVKKDIREQYRKDNKIYHNSEFVNKDKILSYITENDNVLEYNLNPKRIQKIEEIKYNDYVYDLSVPETNKFFANDILVHNTDSMFVAIGDYLHDQGIL